MTDPIGGYRNDPQSSVSSRIASLLLLRANRWLLAGTLFVFTFVGIVGIGAASPVSLRQGVTAGDPIETLFQALLTALITGVTLVVTINQVVISQELGPVGDQRDRMAGALAYRWDVEDVIDPAASPSDPAAFLRALLESTASRASRFSESIAAGSGGSSRTRVEGYVDELAADAARVQDRLEGTDFGTFDVVDAALEFDYSTQLYRARSLRNDPDVATTDAAQQALDDLIEVLAFFGPAREHFKTLYFQWTLIDLSRVMVYTAIPALTVAIAVILFLEQPGRIRGTTIGIDNLLWIVAAATAIAVLPFLLLVSYVLRIATVAKRTLAIGPFVLHEDGPADLATREN